MKVEKREAKRMNGKEYQNLAMRTNDGKCSYRMETVMTNLCMAGVDYGAMLNAALGLSGEVGELNDMLKKHIFHDKPFDEMHFKREIGDILWYVALMCESFGFDMDEVMKLNIEKLKARYPDGFDTERANNRSAGDV